MHGHGSGAFAVLVLSWWVMMAVMMVPLAWPWLRALHRLEAAGGAGPKRGLSPRVLPAFTAGYLLVWLGFSFGASALQLLVAPTGSAEPRIRAGILLAAGLYQLTPVKEACLKHCRSPLSVLLARWPLGAKDALRTGLEHGIFCLGCCWALMLLALGAGTAGWIWMVALVAVVAVEKLSRPGPLMSRWIGAALVASALVYAGQSW